MTEQMPFELWWSPSMKRFLTRHQSEDDEHLVWVWHGHYEALRHYLGTGLDSNPPMPDDAVRLAPEPPKAAGNCVGRLCAYERALTEEYPDGIEEDSETLPDPVRAAQRVLDFLRSYGDGRVCVAITPLAEYQIPPLYARDLKALAKLADGEIDWQCPEIQPEHARLGRAQRCSLKSGHESPHAWVGKQGSLSTWEAKS